jgi:hypothetical protein
MLLLGLFVLTLIFYSLLRVLFLVWNFILFQDANLSSVVHAFTLGLRFDFMAVAVLTFPAFFLLAIGRFFKRDLRLPVTLAFLSCQVPLLILNLIDVEFYNFMGRRFMMSSVSVAGELQGKIVAVFYSYAGLFLISFFTVAIYLFISRRWYRSPFSKRRFFGLVPTFTAGFATLFILVMGVRGGLQSKPLNLGHAQIFAIPALNNLALNSTFSLIKTYGHSTLPRESWMSREEMIPLMNGYNGVGCTEGLPDFPVKQNVVIIALESFSLEFMGKIHGDKGYTPFLDELAEHSLFFPNAYANGRRSMEGMAALLAGVPALMTEPFISSPFASTRYVVLGAVLGSDYQSTFYHGGANGTMFFDHFSVKAGMNRYYGSSEYPNATDSDGIWGIWDEPFLLNMVADLSTQKTPFAASVLTLTSHNPYRLPAGYEGHYPQGTKPIFEVVGYTDDALKKFFAAAEQQPWYKDTLFVLSADHTHSSGGDRTRYINELGNYRIPILFFHPQISRWPQVDVQEPVQQIDVLPSVLDFLKIKPTEINYLARSVFCPGPRHVVIYLDSSYWLVTRDHVLYMDPRGEAYLSLLENYFVPASEPTQYFTRLRDENEELVIKNQLTKKLYAARQYFSEGLWQNRLYSPASAEKH